MLHASRLALGGGEFACWVRFDMYCYLFQVEEKIPLSLQNVFVERKLDANQKNKVNIQRKKIFIMLFRLLNLL